MLGSLSDISFLSGVAVAKPVQSSTLAAEQKLERMFSSDIKATLNACAKQGGVNLAAGADRDGSIICGNGWRKSSVKFTNYVNTVTDFETAGLLLGFRAGVKSNPNVKPEMLTTWVNTPEKQGKFRQFVQKLILDENAKAGFLSKGSTQSASFLTDRVLQRSLPFLQSPTKFENLTGTSDEYNVIAENFCTAPGMSTTQAKKLASTLDSVQMFAVCYQEAGIVDLVTQELSRSQGAKR